MIDDPVIKQATVNQECMDIIDQLIINKNRKTSCECLSTLPFTSWGNAFGNRSQNKNFAAEILNAHLAPPCGDEQ